jgi:HSP20 family protein
MNLVRWNPLREVATLHNSLNRYFDGDLFPSLWHDDKVPVSTWHPVVDVYEEEESYVVKAELPGMDRKDIEVDIKDGVLTLTGQRSAENEVKEGKFFRKERAYGKFYRAFNLPDNLNEHEIKAEFKDGLLTITLPKPEEKKPRQITVH